MSGADVTSESLVRWAAYRINSNQTILPNISLEVYLCYNYFDMCYWFSRYTIRTQTSNVAQNIAAALALSSPVVDIAITSIEDTNNGITSEILSTFGVYILSKRLSAIYTITDIDHGYFLNLWFVFIKAAISIPCADFIIWLLSSMTTFRLHLIYIIQSATAISLLRKLNISIVAYCYSADG